MHERCDTSVEQDVEAMLERVRTQHGPLRVVVHAAGVAAGAALQDQDAETMRHVWRPKADGAWFLHEHTVRKDQQLGTFILYSSLSAIFGNRSQLNYCAANEYLDGLARWRRTRGLPATSVQWPFVSGVGMVGSVEQVDKKLSVSPEVVKWVVKTAVQKSLQSQDLPVWPVLTRDYVLTVAEMPTLKFMMSNLKVRV